MKRKNYTAPEAQLICLVQNEDLATGWNSNKSGWRTDGFFWKQDGVNIPTSTGGSVSTYWYDFGTEELD